MERSCRFGCLDSFIKNVHSALRPVTPDIEATIHQTLLASGWTQEPVFDGYVEEYLW